MKDRFRTIALTGAACVSLATGCMGELEEQGPTPQAENIEALTAKGAARVDHFVLVDAQTDRELRRLSAGSDTIELARDGRALNVRAVTTGSVRQVRFRVKETGYTALERGAPYAVFRDYRGDYNPWRPAPGRYTIVAEVTDTDGSTSKAEISLRVVERRAPEVSVVLLNAHTDRDIRELGDQAAIDLAKEGRRLNIGARPKGGLASVGKVRFSFDGANFVESRAPYIMAGHDGSDYKIWTPPVGDHTLSVEVEDASGDLVASRVIELEVSDSGAAKPPPAPAPFDAAPQVRKGPLSRGLRMAPKLREFEPTMRGLGIEWDLEGDSDHDAQAQISYRKRGESRWQRTLDLMRIDYELTTKFGQNRRFGEPRAFDMFAGSLLALEPGQTYDVKLESSDPAGGEATLVRSVRTRPEPGVARGARRLYVKPGSGGGRGSESSPYRGIAEAERHARPGDELVLLDGDYGHMRFNKSGKSGERIAWRAKNRHRVRARKIDVNASHIWLDGFYVKAQSFGKDTGIRGDRDGGARDVALTHHKIREFGTAIATSDRENSHWIITDNDIVGSNNPNQSNFEGEGILLSFGSHHDVGYNKITRVADGVSYPRRNCDIYHNDISRTSDDGIEPDYGYANVRVRANRMRDFHNFALSFQPQMSGPWYIVRNDIVADSRYARVLKFNGQTDRNVFVHNTFVNRTVWQRKGDRPYLTNVFDVYATSFSRNNVFYVADGPVWRADRKSPNDYLPGSSFYDIDWRTNMRRDALYTPDRPRITWFGKRYDRISDFVADKGKGRIRDLIWMGGGDLNLDGSRVTPRDGAKVVDAGDSLRDLTRGYKGAAPDCGAHERGAPATHYGPR